MLKGVLSKNFHEIRESTEQNLSIFEPPERSIRGTARGVFFFFSCGAQFENTDHFKLRSRWTERRADSGIVLNFKCEFSLHDAYFILIFHSNFYKNKKGHFLEAQVVDRASNYPQRPSELNFCTLSFCTPSMTRNLNTFEFWFTNLSTRS